MGINKGQKVSTNKRRKRGFEKLNEHLVSAIRSSGDSCTNLGRLLGVTEVSVRLARVGSNYRHVAERPQVYDSATGRWVKNAQLVWSETGGWVGPDGIEEPVAQATSTPDLGGLEELRKQVADLNAKLEHLVSGVS